MKARTRASTGTEMRPPATSARGNAPRRSIKAPSWFSYEIDPALRRESPGVCVCRAGAIFCTDEGCVDPLSDPAHCGGCSPCPAERPICASGKCQDCDTGLTNCTGTCEDLNFDFFNCGTCGKQCPVNNACIGGKCIAGN